MSQYVMPISETMRSDVDLVLNEAVPDDAPDRSSIEITERPSYGSYRIECTFFGDDRVTEERFEVIPFEIRKLEIKQNFTENYTDEITLTVSLMPVQYLQLYDNSRGLKCTIKFTRADRNNGHIETEPVITREYLVIFKDKTDIRKKYSKQALVPDNAAQMTADQQGALIPDVEFQLLEQSVYNIRKIKFNYILRDVTVKDAILMVCKICEIKTVGIVPPDNTKTYENFVIPPNMTFDQMMSYIQSYFGVYNKGLGYYYTQDVLYVYPNYETDPSTPESAHFYYVGNNYTGIEVTHAFSNEIIHIVINNFAKAKDLQDEGAENAGTAVIIQDASRVIDSATTIGESSSNPGTGLGKVTVSELNTSIFSAGENDVGMTYNTYQPMFAFDNSNPYRIRTELNNYRRVLMELKWSNAQPFTLLPGYRIYYHYDSEDVENRDSEDTISASSMYDTKTGICASATYTFTQAGRFGSLYIYTCEAKLILSLSYTSANSEPTGSTTASTDNARATKEVSSGGQDTPALRGMQTIANNSIARAGTSIKVGLF